MTNNPIGTGMGKYTPLLGFTDGGGEGNRESGTGWGKQNLILTRPVAMRTSLSTHLSFT